VRAAGEVADDSANVGLEPLCLKLILLIPSRQTSFSLRTAWRITALSRVNRFARTGSIFSPFSTFAKPTRREVSSQTIGVLLFSMVAVTDFSRRDVWYFWDSAMSIVRSSGHLYNRPLAD
jgi:hypothetical protein